jgi:hypothetical protein
MVKVGGADAGPELTAYLEADVSYWTAIQPQLTPGWWNVICRICESWRIDTATTEATCVHWKT